MIVKILGLVDVAAGLILFDYGATTSLVAILLIIKGIMSLG
jgi:hypothetical protein